MTPDKSRKKSVSVLGTFRNLTLKDREDKQHDSKRTNRFLAVAGSDESQTKADISRRSSRSGDTSHDRHSSTHSRTTVDNRSASSHSSSTSNTRSTSHTRDSSHTRDTSSDRSSSKSHGVNESHDKREAIVEKHSEVKRYAPSRSSSVRWDYERQSGYTQTNKFLKGVNWRDKLNQAQKKTYEAVRSQNTFEARTVDGVLLSEQVAGTIMWHWDIRTCHRRCRQGHEHFTAENGTYVSKKGRYWVIVRCVGDKLIETPIFTNHDTGLERLSLFQRRHYSSLRPKHANAKKFVNQSPNNPVLEVESMRDRHGNEVQLRETMVTPFNELFKRELNCPDLRVVGALSEHSTKALCGLVKQAEEAREIVWM